MYLFQVLLICNKKKKLRQRVEAAAVDLCNYILMYLKSYQSIGNIYSDVTKIFGFCIYILYYFILFKGIKIFLVVLLNSSS